MSNKTEREELIERANLMKLEFPGNISTKDLKALVNKELDKEPSGKEDTGLDLNKAIAEQRKEQTKLIRCMVSCNDPQMKDWETTPYLHISNAVLNLPRIVVPLNVEWHIPKIYVDFLKKQKCTISYKAKDAKGRPVTRTKEINKYNVAELPALTEKELEELKQAQLMRDGVKK